MSVAAMTYETLAGRLGINVASARRLVLRKRWKKTRSNDDGRTLVQVPDEFLQRRDDSRSDDHNDSPTTAAVTVPETVVVTDVLSRHIARLEGEIALLRDRASERDVIAGQLEALRAVLEATREERDRWAALAVRPWWKRLTG